MLKKNIRRRLAVLVISSLGTGLFSTLTVPTANAGAQTFSDSATNIALAANKMYAAILTAGTAVASNTIASNATKSLASSISYNDGAAGGTDQTLTMRADGTLSLYTGAPSNNLAMFVASGGTFSSAVGAGGTPALARNASNTAQYSAATTSTSVLWTPGAAGSYTVSLYTGTGVDATFASLVGGTKVSEIAVTVLPENSFFTFTGTTCATYDSAGNPTSTQTSITSAVVPRGSVLTVTSTTAANILKVGAPGLITAGTNTVAGDGLSVPLTTVRSSSGSVTPQAVGSFTMRLEANGAEGTATDTISITVVQSCASGTWSINKSFIENQVSGAVSVADDNVDDTPFWTNAQTAIIGMLVNNAYGAAVPVGTWVVSATNGALVGITSGGNTTAPSCGSTSTASVVGTGADIKVGICQGTDYAAQLSTVTVSYGSTTILTKTVLITGDVARIDVNTVETGKTGTVNFRTFKASAYDAAGNRVAVNPSADASTLDQNVTAADIGTTSVSADIQDTNTFTCGTGAKGSTNVVFQVTAASGATVKSAPVKLTCASTTRTYTAALDKAVYAPGDIATLTITAKDSNGAAPFDSHKTASTGAADDTFNYVNGSNAIPSISGSQMTPVAALTAADEFAGGVKTYTFIVGSTEGSYQMAVNLTGVTTDTAKTVAYQVKNSTTTITDAELYASIVKLIAAINKQIRALQKSLKR